MRGGDAFAQRHLAFAEERGSGAGVAQEWPRLPWFFLIPVTNPRPNLLMGRKELAKCGYESSDIQREIVVVASSFETNTYFLLSLKDPRKHMLW